MFIRMIIMLLLVPSLTHRLSIFVIGLWFILMRHSLLAGGSVLQPLGFSRRGLEFRGLGLSLGGFRV